MSVEVILFVVVALVVGLLLGWLLGGRAAATVRAELAAVQSRVEQGEETVARLRDAATALEGERDRLRTSETEARIELEGANVRAEEQKQTHEQLVSELKEMRESLQLRFGEVARQALEDAQGQFLKRADERFRQSEETTGQGLKALLQPVEATLKRYEDNLSKVEKEREGSYRELNKAVSDLAFSNDVVRRETSRLADVMRSSPKHRGRWGEEQTQTILESAGLREGIDFSKQTSVNDGERALRPDFVVNLPGNRCIVIDVKCPLVHFEAAFDEQDEKLRLELLKQHADAVRSYANDLGKKAYWKQFDLSPEFVVLFVPGEHFLSAAAERSPDLITDAFRNGVVIASTINLLALAKVMAGMWRQEALHRQAEEIGALGRELYGRLCTMGGHVAKVGRNLDTAVVAYNAFVGSYERNVLTSAERFEKLGVETGGKKLERLPIVEQSTNPLVKISSAMSDEESSE